MTIWIWNYPSAWRIRYQSLVTSDESYYKNLIRPCNFTEKFVKTQNTFFQHFPELFFEIFHSLGTKNLIFDAMPTSGLDFWHIWILKVRPNLNFSPGRPNQTAELNFEFVYFLLSPYSVTGCKHRSKYKLRLFLTQSVAFLAISCKKAENHNKMSWVAVLFEALSNVALRLKSQTAFEKCQNFDIFNRFLL